MNVRKPYLVRIDYYLRSTVTFSNYVMGSNPTDTKKDSLSLRRLRVLDILAYVSVHENNSVLEQAVFDVVDGKFNV